MSDETRRVRAGSVMVGESFRWCDFAVTVRERRQGPYNPSQRHDRDWVYLVVDDPVRESRRLNLHYYAGEEVELLPKEADKETAPPKQGRLPGDAITGATNCTAPTHPGEPK